MDIFTARQTNAVYRERLQQAVRVMQDVAANPQGRRFNIGVFLAVDFAEDEQGILEGCIASFCALDPWFRKEGLTIDLEGPEPIEPSVMPDDFFGTPAPFYTHQYGTRDAASITLDDAIAALNRAIAELPPRILRVSIGPMPQALGDPLPKVHAYFDDGTDADLFAFFPDEISFTESEFVGLTSSEATILHGRKDVAYLQS